VRKITGRILGLLIVTGVAVVLAISVTAGGWGRKGEVKPAVDLKAAATPVSVMEVRLEPIEVTDTYAGMIRPRERFTLGFEVAGRVEKLGTNEAAGGGAPSAAGKPLDEGDEVTAGQLLARLDNRAHLARLEEARARYAENQAKLKDASARREQAHDDMRRAEGLRRRGGSAITEAEYRQYVTNLAVAEAQYDAAKAQVSVAAAQFEIVREEYDNTFLRAPVDGVIAKRHVNVGESLSPHQPVMEIIQVDRVLLVVGVPEAYVSHVRSGQNVHVELLARDRFGRKRPELQGRVQRVAEAADQTTGLFEVEIAVDNPQRRWKPGLIALGHIVVQQMQGYRVPLASAVFREEETFLFSVDGSGVARKVPVGHWIEQGRDLILERLPPEHRRVVVRGQHRLVDGRPVELVELEGSRLPEMEVPTARGAAAVAEAERESPQGL